VDQKLLGPLDHFTLRIFEKYQGSDEIRLIFDRYDLPSSLKEPTRPKRQRNATSVYYHITPSTHIAKVTMKKLLSHVNTKKELTEYFAQKIIETAQRMGRNAVVSWACECKGTMRNMAYLKSNQEEVDTKIILHALDATTNGATEIKIHSPDTDVFILALTINITCGQFSIFELLCHCPSIRSRMSHNNFQLHDFHNKFGFEPDNISYITAIAPDETRGGIYCNYSSLSVQST
jgi:hypothetical protein